MESTNNDYHVVGAGAAVTYANRGNDRPAERPGDLPGIVIFIHGVNDPGATYSFVEEGLCKGLNERLSRNDLQPGTYGVDYKESKAKKKPSKQDADILADPDTYLYQRQEILATTKSSFIPFYWGYRATNDEIARVDNTGDVKSRVADANGNLMTRGQYQDIHGNRLDSNFGKAGGFFANATTNIPEVYGEGFKADLTSQTITELAWGGPTLYAADAASRRYYVLAATRLANLISTIRTVKPAEIAAAQGMLPEHETISIMGHSQGTILTLLAQAILRQRGQRCVDCIIMVDTPYSLYETKGCDQTGHAKLKTLVDIVNEVAQTRHTIPDLAEMLISHEKHGGRAGPDWTPSQGKRLDKTGKNWITFDERDNRGKVYLYFCPEDTVVSLSAVHGIGAFGVPDEVPADGAALKSAPKAKTMPAMKTLEKKGFFQRMWTRMERDHQYDGKYKKVLVGTAPGRFPIRTQTERLTPGPNVGILDQVLNTAIYQSFEPNDIRHINGEELKPPCEPRLYGGETVVGGPRPGHADKAGEMIPDDVTKDVILGNQYAKLNWVYVGPNTLLSNDVEQQKAAFNAGRPYDEQSQNWRLGNPDEFGLSSTVEREETPKEARERMETDRHALEANNYHSGILHDAENHRWVTAMDVAIGQAVTMDDPDWHALLVLIADWKLSAKNYAKIKSNGAYARLTAEDKAFIKACFDYYRNGRFPDDEFVSMTPPPLVTSELTPKALETRRQAEQARLENETKYWQGQVGRGMANLGTMR